LIWGVLGYEFGISCKSQATGGPKKSIWGVLGSGNGRCGHAGRLGGRGCGGRVGVVVGKNP